MFVEDALPNFVLIVEEDSSPVFIPVDVPEKFIAEITPVNIAFASFAYVEEASEIERYVVEAVVVESFVSRTA